MEGVAVRKDVAAARLALLHAAAHLAAHKVWIALAEHVADVHVANKNQPVPVLPLYPAEFHSCSWLERMHSREPRLHCEVQKGCYVPVGVPDDRRVNRIADAPVARQHKRLELRGGYEGCPLVGHVIPHEYDVRPQLLPVLRYAHVPLRTGIQQLLDKGPVVVEK